MIKRLKKAAVFCMGLSMFFGSIHFQANVSVFGAGHTVEVDWMDEKQSIDGLGASFAFNKETDLKYIYDNDPIRGRELLDLIFSDEKGIGLDILRIIVSDGDWQTIWPTKEGGYVWDAPDWKDKKDSFCQAQQWIVKEAMSYGVSTIYATAWSPPAWMKSNGRTDGGGTLIKEYYQDYADYLVEFVLGYKREFGITVTHLSPTNESETAHTGYSGFVIRPNEYIDFINNYLAPALKKAEESGRFNQLGMSVPFLVGPEGSSLEASAGISGSYYGSAIRDEEIKQNISVFSTHLYGTGSFNYGPLVASVQNEAIYPNVLRDYRLWQTEYMDRSDNSSAVNATQYYNSTGITDGVKWANLLTNMFTSDPVFNAYLWWWPIAQNGADGSDLIRLTTTGTSRDVLVTGEYRAFKRLYTFGNFSRFVNPGYIRVEATRVPVAGMNVSAYKSPTTEDFAIVAVNNDKSENRTVDFNLKQFPSGTNAVVGYRTSASENQKLIGPFPVSNGSFSADIPADSVITFVPESEANLPGLNWIRDIFSTLEAEDNDGLESKIAVSGDDGILTGLSDGDVIRFNNVNFGDGSANGGIVRRHILSMRTIAASKSGGIIEVRIGSADGRIVGVFTIPPGGEPYTTEFEIQIDTGDNAARGYQDVYLVIHGDGDDLFDIDYFEFDQTLLDSGSVLINGSFEEEPGEYWVGTYGHGTALFEKTVEQYYSAYSVDANLTVANSIKITERSYPGEGISQDITGKLVEGQQYRVSGYFMPTVESTGSIYLVGTVAAGGTNEELLVERADMKPRYWSQVDAVFTYSPEMAYEKLQIVFGDSSTEPLYIEEVTLAPYNSNKSELIALLGTIEESIQEPETLELVKTARAIVISTSTEQTEIDNMMRDLITTADFRTKAEYDEDNKIVDTPIVSTTPEPIAAQSEETPVNGNSGYIIAAITAVILIGGVIWVFKRKKPERS